MSIKINITLDNRDALAAFDSKVPNDIQMYKGRNYRILDMPAERAFEITDALKDLSISAASVHDPITVYYDRIMQALVDAGYLKKPIGRNSTIYAYFLNNFEDFREDGINPDAPLPKLPAFPKARANRALEPRKKRAEIFEIGETGQDETPLIVWMKQTIGPYIRMDVYYEIVDAIPGGFPLYMAALTMHKSSRIYKGDIYDVSSYRADEIYAVASDGALVVLPTDGNSLGIIPAEISAMVEATPPASFWKHDWIYYVELAADHPKNTFGRKVAFELIEGTTDYKEPLDTDPRDL